MILPITVYGNPILKKEAELVDFESKEINVSELVENMFETMYQANGVGLAAPQVNMSLALFVVDTAPFFDGESEGEKPLKKAFFNPEVLEFLGENLPFNEGCLSVPTINEDVVRKEGVRLYYQDINGNEYEEEFHGKAARVIQHEYDHLLGKTFVDRLSPLKRTLLKSKLNEIVSGKRVPAYRIKPNKK